MNGNGDSFEKMMAEKVRTLLGKLRKGGNEEKLCGSKYGLNYFEQLRTEWSLLLNPLTAIGPSGAGRMQILLDTKAEDLTFSDLYAFERMLTRAVPFDRLKRLAPSIRLEYKDCVGVDAYREYEAGKPPPATEADENELRTDVEQLQAELQWLYIIQPLEEKSRNSLTKWLLLAMFLLTLAIIAWIVLWRTMLGEKVPPVGFVLFAGALGATFSAQRRIQTTAGGRSTLVNIIRSGSVRLSVQIAPVIGALSAMVLAFLFASGLLSGALFPEFTVTALFNPLVLGAGGTADAVFAKLMIWSFIAGFAERLVPDALDRFATQADKQKPEGSSQ
jgi:hypothetical protein